MKKIKKSYTLLAVALVATLSLGGIVYASASTTSPNYIGKTKAKQNALTHAGLKESDVHFVKVNLDKDSKNAEYDIEFYTGNKEYDYEIDAVSGKVLSSDFDIEDKDYTNSNTSTNYIGETKAKQNALTHAGLKESDVHFVKVKLDKDSKNAEYDIEFYTGNKEYDYEIDAVSGKVLSSNFDIEDKDSSNKNDTENDTVTSATTSKNKSTSDTTKTDNYIGTTSAKNIALTNANLKSDNVIGLSCDLDDDNGKLIYEIDFHVGNKEYEYEIDAVTGKIIFSTSEVDN